MDRSRPDYFTRKAKKSGYPARSVFKLEEINAKYRILRKGQRVLDIGAAPGSWSMFASRKIGPEGRVVSVDLKECRIPSGYGNITVYTGDAFSPEIKNRLSEKGPFDLILSDAAPATTGNKTIDTSRSTALAEECIQTGISSLKAGGNLVFKLFQGGDEKNLMQQLRSLFETVKIFKPKSSRKDSFEIFFIATGFQPPVDSHANTERDGV